MEWKIIITNFLGAFVIFLIWFITALLSGWIFHKNGDYNKLVLVVNVLLLSLLFVGATVRSSIEISQSKKNELTVEAAKKEVLTEQKKMSNQIDDSKNEILKEIRNLYKRALNEHEIKEVNFDEAAKGTYEIAKNKNANILLKKGYEKKGGIGLWFTPQWDSVPKHKFYLVDFVGNLKKNRISVYITQTPQLIYQILTSDGKNEKIEVDISSWEKGKPYLIIVQWQTEKNRIELFINEDNYEKIIPNLHFDKLGPIVFMGIDFEGNFPSDFKTGGPSIAEGLKHIGMDEFKQENKKSVDKPDTKSSESIEKQLSIDEIKEISDRPYISIKPDTIVFENWTEKEKKDDPEVTNKCEKIHLYFIISNSSEVPAANVDISAISYIIEEKDLGGFHPGKVKLNYQHNLHLIEKNEPGRQPFLLALDKNAVKYFKDGTIKVKLIVKIKYGELKSNNKYWTEEAFIYSPTFRNQAEEIYSKGG